MRSLHLPARGSAVPINPGYSIACAVSTESGALPLTACSLYCTLSPQHTSVESPGQIWQEERMKRPSLTSIAATRPMWVLRLAFTTTLALTTLQAKAQKEVPAATAQKIPPNVKTHVMTLNELKKSQKESLRQSKATPGRLVRNPAVASKRARPEVLTILQQQKAFVTSRGLAITPTQAHPSALLGNQTPPAAGTAMNSGPTGNSAQPATSGMLSRSTPLLAPQTQPLARPVLQGQAAPAAGTAMNSGHPKSRQYRSTDNGYKSRQ